MKRNIRISALLALLAVAGSANAGLIGDTVGVKYVGGSGSVSDTVVVGAGEEGDFFGNQFYNFSDTGFSIRSTSNYCGIFSCWGNISLMLTSLNIGTPITGVTFSTNLHGVTSSFTSTSVTFSWKEQSISRGTYLTSTFNTRPTSVPEPASLALMGMGLAGLGLGAARRRAHK